MNDLNALVVRFSKKAAREALCGRMTAQEQRATKSIATAMCAIILDEIVAETHPGATLYDRIEDRIDRQYGSRGAILLSAGEMSRGELDKVSLLATTILGEVRAIFIRRGHKRSLVDATRKQLEDALFAGPLIAQPPRITRQSKHDLLEACRRALLAPATTDHMRQALADAGVAL